MPAMNSYLWLVPLVGIQQVPACVREKHRGLLASSLGMKSKRKGVEPGWFNISSLSIMLQHYSSIVFSQHLPKGAGQFRLVYFLPSFHSESRSLLHHCKVLCVGLRDVCSSYDGCYTHTSQQLCVLEVSSASSSIRKLLLTRASSRLQHA